MPDCHFASVPVRVGVLELLLFMLDGGNVNLRCYCTIEKLLRIGFWYTLIIKVGLSDFLAVHQLARPTQSVPNART